MVTGISPEAGSTYEEYKLRGKKQNIFKLSEIKEEGKRFKKKGKLEDGIEDQEDRQMPKYGKWRQVAMESLKSVRIDFEDESIESQPQ